MRKTVQVILILFCCLHYQSVNAQNVNPYVNNEKNYSIELPQSWVYSYDKNALVSVLMACDSLDVSNALIITTGATGALSLNEAMKVTKRNMGLGKKIPIDSEGDDVINGMNTKWCVFNFDTKSGVRKIKMYIFKKGSRQYTIQLKLLPNEFDSKIRFFEEVVATFKILN